VFRQNRKAMKSNKTDAISGASGWRKENTGLKRKREGNIGEPDYSDLHLLQIRNISAIKFAGKLVSCGTQHRRATALFAARTGKNLQAG
jgi:hypothetical protein